MDPLERLGLPPGVKNLVFLGEAGCGKSEIAVNLAVALVPFGKPVHLFDLDMTKPLFRSRDLRETLEAAGVALHFEEQFMDAPTLTGGVARLLGDGESRVLLDVGGDHIGARAIGGYSPLLRRADTAVWYVIDPFRPWSGDLEHIDRVLGEVLGASHVGLEGVHFMANPNLGRETVPGDVVRGFRQVERQVGPYKPVELCCVREDLMEAVGRELSVPLLPLRPYITYPWEP